jgi:hypothetical protein
VQAFKFQIYDLGLVHITQIANSKIAFSKPNRPALILIEKLSSTGSFSHRLMAVSSSTAALQLQLKEATQTCVNAKQRIEAFCLGHMAPVEAVAKVNVERVEKNILALRSALDDTLQNNAVLFGQMNESRQFLDWIAGTLALIVPRLTASSTPIMSPSGTSALLAPASLVLPAHTRVPLIGAWIRHCTFSACVYGCLCMHVLYVHVWVRGWADSYAFSKPYQVGVGFLPCSGNMTTTTTSDATMPPGSDTVLRMPPLPPAEPFSVFTHNAVAASTSNLKDTPTRTPVPASGTVPSFNLSTSTTTTPTTVAAASATSLTSYLTAQMKAAASAGAGSGLLAPSMSTGPAQLLFCHNLAQ